MRLRAPATATAILLVLCSRAVAQQPAVTLQASPPAGGGSNYALNEQVQVTATYCSPFGGGFFTSTPQVLLNSVNTGLPYLQGFGSCDDYGEITGTITLTQAGNNTLETGVANNTGWSDASVGLYVGTPPPPPPPPTVTAGGPLIVPAPASGIKGTFRVVANSNGTHTFSAVCGPVASCTAGAVSPASAYLLTGDFVDVTVTFNVSGAELASGQVVLTATNSGSSQATLTVRVAPRDQVIARNRCLTVAVGPNAAFECGDLRVVHPLPSVRTLNRDRAPMLIYSSQHARPRPIVDTTVTLASAADSVRATLTIAGLPAQSRSWSGTQFPIGQPRRVGVAVDATSLATGIYRATLEVRRFSGGVGAVIATRADSIPIVNRSGSVFGAGWWLAGFEQLVFLPAPQGGGIMWVGGDGSVRRYVSIGNNTYVATPVDRPDTLVYRPAGSEYVRSLSGGDSVVFSASGFHVRTVTHLGHRTSFRPDPNGRLEKVVLVSQPADSLTYAFSYLSNRLSQVVAPDTAGGPGRTTVVLSSGRINSIQDPGTPAVTFAYGTGADSTRIEVRTDARGVPTRFAFNAVGRLREAKLGLSSAASDTIRYTFAAVAESRGLATPEDPSAQHPDSVFTRLDGPRTDSSDVTTFWPDRFGGVSKVRDPYGNQTTVTYGDVRWPGLATQVVDASGFTTQATYDSHGNVISTTAVNPLGNGSNAVTTYAWDFKWDAVTYVRTPSSVVTLMAYDPATGNRLWQQTGLD